MVVRLDDFRELFLVPTWSIKGINANWTVPAMRICVKDQCKKHQQTPTVHSRKACWLIRDIHYAGLYMSIIYVVVSHLEKTLNKDQGSEGSSTGCCGPNPLRIFNVHVDAFRSYM